MDLQRYHLHRDQAGRALLRELRDAAARGVRVHLRVDDFYAAQIGELLHDLAVHAGVQLVRFNPLPFRWRARLRRRLASPGDFEVRNGGPAPAVAPDLGPPQAMLPASLAHLQDTA